MIHDKDILFLSGLFVVGVLLFFGVSVLKVIVTNVHEEVVVERCEIVSLAYERDIRGGFVLGIGFVGDKSYYIAYQKTKGGFKLIKIPTNSAIIIEKEGISSGEILKIYYKGLGKLKWISVEAGYKIIVPQGTIVRKFTL